MCIPPVGELASPHFALLGEIARRNGIAELSMGMSADWPLAVQLGRDLCAGRERDLRDAGVTPGIAGVSPALFRRTNSA